MSKFTFKKSLLIIALALLPMTFFGQNENTEKPKSNNHWHIGIEGGATTLFSDNKPFMLDKTSWDVSVSFGYTFAKFITVYTKLGYFNLAGEKANYFTLDECNFFNGNFNVGFDIMQLIKYKPDRKFGFGPHIGYGQLQSRSKSTYKNGKVFKWGYDEEDGHKGGGIKGRRVIYELPMGMDFTYNFSKRLAIYADLTLVKTDTECLDAVPSGDHRDWYGYANIGCRFKFGYKKDKPQEEPEEEVIEEQPVEETQAPVEEVIEEVQPEEIEAEEEAEVAPAFEERDIKLTFAVGKATVQRTQANMDEVDKISQDLDNGRVITNITVVGYASPEGGKDLNENLSKERAKATVAFIKERLGEKARGIKFESEFRGADWEGFYKALENSDIANKNEIINEIKKSDNPSATLSKLAAKNPTIKNLYGQLRRGQIIIK